jgi:hypothetical protein
MRSASREVQIVGHLNALEPGLFFWYPPDAGSSVVDNEPLLQRSNNKDEAKSFAVLVFLLVAGPSLSEGPQSV